MALEVGDILQITDYQVLAQQTLLNVYFYEVMELGSLTDYADISNTFQTFATTYVEPTQNENLFHLNTFVKNVTNGIDLWEDPITSNGNVTGEYLPTFNAYAFRLVRTTGITRHGAKRIGGISESSTTGNGVTSGMLTILEALAAQMELPLNIDASSDHDFVARPVIVGRFPQGHANEGQLDLSKINPVSAVQYIRVTSQTTRRVGRGI